MYRAHTGILSPGGYARVSRYAYGIEGSKNVKLKALAHTGCPAAWQRQISPARLCTLSQPMEEEVYIRFPGEMPRDSGDRVIWKVHKAMNGLRQSPRLFQGRLAHPC